MPVLVLGTASGNGPAIVEKSIEERGEEVEKCVADYAFFAVLRRLIQAIARNAVATISTTKVAIGSHSAVRDAGVYVAPAIIMEKPSVSYLGGFAVIPTMTQLL